MMRYLSRSFVLLAVLGACTPVAPNDGEFAGTITGGTAVQPAGGTAAPTPETIAPVDLDAPSGATTVTQTIDRTNTGSQTSAPEAPASETITVDLTGDAAKPADAPKVVLPVADGSISNSQDFTVVKSKETIESDAAKLEVLKSQYKVVEPGAAPKRSSDVNLAQFALAQTNPVGQKAYSRFGIGGARKAERKCAVYSTVDDAQAVFLQRGGPQKDGLGLDPDGDGYACSWSPETYKALLGLQ